MFEGFKAPLSFWPIRWHPIELQPRMLQSWRMLGRSSGKMRSSEGTGWDLSGCTARSSQKMTAWTSTWVFASMEVICRILYAYLPGDDDGLEEQKLSTLEEDKAFANKAVRHFVWSSVLEPLLLQLRPSGDSIAKGPSTKHCVFPDSAQSLANHQCERC